LAALQYPSKKSAVKSDVPFKIQFIATAYSIYTESRNTTAQSKHAIGGGDIIMPIPHNLVRNNDIKYGVGETETGHLFDLTTGGAWEFLKTLGGGVSFLQDLFGVSSLLGQRPMDMRDSIYEGADFRVHGFEWRMVPKSKEDAENIQKICETFQVLSYPALSGYQSSSRVIHPPVWHINGLSVGGLGRGEGKSQSGLGTDKNWMFKCLPSVLRKVTIDTTPEGTYGFAMGVADGYPAVTKLRLDFVELEPAVNDNGKLVSRSQTK